MAGLQNNLYPPIIETYMPAFLNTEACKVYFSLSRYNSYNEIKKNAQVVVNNQNTNLSMLSTSKYPTGIMLTQVYEDEFITGDNRFYIIINPSDLEDGIFEINQYYKIQIRFTAASATEPQYGAKGEQQIAKWLVDNQNLFSEWSTVCLIKGISRPIIELKNFDNSTDDFNLLPSTSIDLIGNLFFIDEAETETLKSYRIQIYKDITGELVYDSRDIFANNYRPNEINHTVIAPIEENVKYYMDFIYTTNNLYIKNEEFHFTVLQAGTSIDAILNVSINKYLDDFNRETEYDSKKIKVEVIFNSDYVGNLIIRRSSNKSNFHIWEDIHIKPLSITGKSSYIWYDITAQSGEWYKYSIQNRDGQGNRGIAAMQKQPAVMLYLDDIYLCSEGKQLKIKFNPQINSFKRTLMENKVETLGSKYPFIRRNGDVDYRQFPISGTISHWMDEDGDFLSKERDELTKEYNLANHIYDHNDFIYERDFREAVISFLYSDSVKLFKSTTEGNLLVRLMDINLTPEKVLGRMIYSFNATAYEVDDCSIVNYDKYNIQPIGQVNNSLIFDIEKINEKLPTSGILTLSSLNADMVQEIREEISNSAPIGYTDQLIKITRLKIDFKIEPTTTYYNYYWIDENNNVSRTDNGGEKGVLIYVNNEPRFIPAGVDAIDINTGSIDSVTIAHRVKVVLTYTAIIRRSFNKKVYTDSSYYYKLGQINDNFETGKDSVEDGVNIVDILTKKYQINTEDYQTRLISVNTIESIELPEGASASWSIKFTNNENTGGGILPNDHPDKLDDTIESFSFDYMIFKRGNDKENLGDYEYWNSGLDYDSVESLKNNYIYSVNDKSQIYHNGSWYNAAEGINVAKVYCPVPASITYTYKLFKGEY